MPKLIELEFLCDLSEDEVRLKSQEVGAAVVEYDEIESQKKDAAKEYAEQLDGVRQTMRKLAGQIRSRTEKRMVQCQVDYHVPQIGFKRTTRLDTGEIVREEPMTPAERQQRMFPEPEARAPEAGNQSELQLPPVDGAQGGESDGQD